MKSPTLQTFSAGVNSVISGFTIPSNPIAALTPGRHSMLRMSTSTASPCTLPCYFNASPILKKRTISIPDSGQWKFIKKAADALGGSATEAKKITMRTPDKKSRLVMAREMAKSPAEIPGSSEDIFKICADHLTAAMLVFGSGGFEAKVEAGQILMAGAKIATRRKNFASKAPHRYFVEAFLAELAAESYVRALDYKNIDEEERFGAFYNSRIAMSSAAQAWIFGASVAKEQHALARAAILGAIAEDDMMHGYSLFMLSHYFGNTQNKPRKGAEVAIAATKGFLRSEDINMLSYAGMTLSLAYSYLQTAMKRAHGKKLRPLAREVYKLLV